MKIASQLVSAAPNTSVKATSAQDTGTGFQNVFANANGTAAKNPLPQAPASKDASSPVNSRTTGTTGTTEAKKKDAAPDQTIASLEAMLTQTPVPVPQAAALPVDDAAVAQKDGEEARGASFTGQFAVSTGVDSSLAAVVKGAASEATCQDPSIAKVTSAAGKTAPGAGPANSNGPLHAMVSAANAESATTADAAKAKSSQGEASVSQAGSTHPDGASRPESVSVSSSENAVIAAAQSVAAPAQPPSISSVGPMSMSQLQESVSTAAAKSLAGVSPAGAAKGTAGAAVKGKPASDDLRGKKSDDADSTQAAGGTVGAPFAAKVSDAMAAGRRDGGGTQSAIDAAGLLQGGQTSGHAAGLAGGQAAGQAAGQAPNPASGQGAAAAQDAKAALDTAAQAASGARGPAGADAMPGVSSAHLVQSANSSEMRLGMQSAEFGNISISTSLNHQSISAQISIDHSELGRALAAHLPAIEEKLGTAYGVQAKVELRDSNNPSQSGDSGYSNSGQQSKEQRQSQAGAGQTGGIQGVAAAGVNQHAMLTRMSALTSATVAGAASASRLDIRI